MANDLVINLRLNDKASVGLDRAKTKLQAFATSFKANWLKITAAITASIFAINKALDLIKLSARFRQQEQAFRNLAATAGVSADQIVRQLRRMSGETLSTADIMQQASRAMILGIAPDQLPRLMEISRASARAFGEDVDFMFESIVLGIGRQSRMILDNLGIIVKAEEAYEEYAVTLGKTVNELTDLEKRQAFANAVMKSGEKIIRDVNIQQKSQLENLQSLSAFWEDFRVKAGDALIKVIQAVSLLVNVLRTSFATVIVKISEAFTFLNEKLATAVEFYDQLIDKIPGITVDFENMSEKLRENAQISQDFAESMQQGTEEFANSANQIFELMTQSSETAVRSSENLRQAVGKVKNEVKETEKGIKQTTGGFATGIANVIIQTQSMGDFWKSTVKQMGQFIIKELVQKALTQLIIKLEIVKKLMDSLKGGPFGFISGFFGFAQGGIVGPKGATKMPLPAFAQGGSVGRAVPVIAHEGEVIGTPQRLAEAGIGGGNVNINIFEPSISGMQDIGQFAEELGFEVESRVRTAGGF